MGQTVHGVMLADTLLPVLQAMGLPKHVISLDIHIDNGPISITCTFHPEAEDGSLAVLGEALATLVGRYKIVEG